MSIQFYQDNADDFFEGTVNVDMSNIYNRFTQYLPSNAIILDAGCGSGRDTKAFLNMGYQLDAFDASSGLVALARKFTGIGVKLAMFDDVDAVNKYDAIWCCASLLHVKSAELLNTMGILSNALKQDGVWYVSFKYGNGERHKDGRDFTYMNENKLEKLIYELDGIDIQDIWITSDNRPDRNEKWLNAILAKR
jgi:SAM-dependent methyltransferase